MAEEDITALKAIADGTSGYGATFRGAIDTLQTRRTPAESLADGFTVVNSYRPVHTQTHGSSGALAINWTNGNYFRVNSAGFNVTGISETAAPSAGAMREGIVEIVNTHGSTTITVDLTSIGMSDPFTIDAGSAQIVFLVSTPAL